MKENVIAVDDKDKQVWQLITDVPKVKTPWQYLCFLLNVIIPGKPFIPILTLSSKGTGTMIVSCFSEKWSKTLFMVGVF